MVLEPPITRRLFLPWFLYTHVARWLAVVLAVLGGYFQPTIQPAESDVLRDFRVLWQSPRPCKLL